MSNKAEKRGLVPKLRFPEFQVVGEWSKEKLGAVGTLYKGKGISKAEIAANGVLPCIRYGELYTIYGETIHEIASSTNVDASELFLSKRNDVIIPASGETKIDIAKASCVMSDDIALGGDLNVIRSSLNGIFLSYQLNGPLRLSIAKVAQGDTVVHLYPTQIERLDVLVPSSIEQQKIADCLASLDELITLEAQKLDTLKTHKKGLMQQLFPAEGETLPKLRFPEFREAREWEELPIGEKIDLLSGYPFDGAAITEDVSGIPLMRGINITEGFVRHSRDIDRFFLGDAVKLEKYRLRIDDLVIGMDGSKVGKNSALISEIDVDTLLVQRVARLRANDEESIHFIFQQINSSKFHAYVDRINTSSGIPHISAKQINDFKICFPSVAEQQKIAEFLASLDDLITAQTQKLVALKTHKKGLMQQLFPTLNEVAA